MIARHTVIRVQTLSKSEYNRSKHIPSAHPSKKPDLETEDSQEVQPTPLPILHNITDSRINESGFRHSLLGSAEKSEIHKRSHRMRDFEMSSPGNESYLVKELQIKNEDLEQTRQEIAHLRQENQKLREEREYMIRDLQQRRSASPSPQKSQRGNADYERHIGVLEEENSRLREEIGRLQLNRSGHGSPERHEFEEMRITVSKVLSERDYLDTQLKQAKTIQISLEQELRQKTDERNKLFSDYEVKIATLQHEIAGYKSQKQGDNLRQSQMLGSLQHENNELTSEVNRLRQQKIELETMLETLRREKLSVDNNLGLRLAELEAANNSNISILDQERRSSQSLRLMLQQKEKDLSTKETEITNLLQQKIQLEANKTTSINPSIVLYMAEIERLQNLVSERTVEIETHKLRQSQEIESVKILSESRLKDSMKLEMLQVNSQLQAERNQTQLELTNLRKTIMDYETKIVLLTDELDKANKRGGFELSSPSYLKPQNERDMFWDDSRRKSEAEKRSGYGMLDVDDLLRSPVERALRSPAVDHGGDRVALENQILTLRLSVEDYEKKQAQMTVEISELQRKVHHVEEEKLRYQIELQAERDRSRGETDRHMFEVQISGYKSRVEDLENKVRVLKMENEGLQQTNLNQQKELGEWRVKFEMVREDIIRESSSERHLLENQLKDMIHHNEELENKIVLIGSELSRLEQLSEALRIERNQWQSKYEEASQHILILKADMETQNKDVVEEELHRLTTQFGKDKESFERQLQDTQQKNYMLVEEVERLHIVLAEKDRDIHALAEEREHVEKDAEEKVEEMQRKYDDMLQDKLDSEVKEKSGQWLSEKRTLETELKGVTQRYRDLEGEMETLHNENIRLHDKLNAANAQLDQQNKNLDQLQLKNTLYIQELKSEVSVQLTTEFEQKIRELTERFGTERSGLDEQIRRLKGRILELEVLVQDKDREVNRLADDAMSHAHEVDTLKNRYEELEKNSVNSLQDLTHKMEQQRNQDIEEVVKKAGNQHQFEKNSLESALMRAQEKVRSLENKVAELCVEHERVVEERNKLGAELDDQREAVNRTSTQYFSEKSTYETRFNALTVKVQEYEKQISTLNDEVNNLKRVNAMQASEIEGMKSTTQNSASQWTIEKTSLEGQKKSLSEQIESLNRKIVVLNGEVERLTAANSKQVIELEEHRRKIESQERDSQNAMEQLRWQLESKYRKEREEFEVSTRQNYDQYKGEYDVNLRKVQRENTELDKRVRLSEAETERLELQLRSKNDETRDLRERISVVENLKNQEIQRLRDAFEVEKRDIENAVFNEKLEAERGHLNAKIKELKQKINDLENRNTYVTVELEKQNSMYRSKSKEVESWQEKYNKLESSRFVEIDQVKSQVEILKRSSLQISDYEVRFKAERSAYEAQILQYKQAMEELEARVKDLASENERVNTLYLERKRELDSLRGQQGKLDVGFHKEVDSLRRENEALKREKFDFNALKVKFEVERKAYENEIAQLQHAMSTKKIEIAKLYDLIDTRRVESENLAQELLEAREEIAKNLKYCKELEGEYLELNSKYDQVIKEAGDLQRSKELYRSQIDQSQRELAKRNRELIHKIHEVDSIKSRYEEAYAAVEPMGTMTSKVITRLSGMDHSKLG